jgi:hypothetical protein
MKLKTLAVSVCTLIAIMGCSKTDTSSPKQNSNPPEVASNSIGKWIREEKKDPFDDSVFLRYSLDDTSGNGTAFLLVDCNKEKQIRFNWQYGQGTKGAPFGPMDMKVEIRLDGGQVIEEEWVWSASNPLLRPKNIEAFLETLIGKSKVALRETITQTTMVFDIKGFDNAYADVKKTCGKS